MLNLFPYIFGLYVFTVCCKIFAFLVLHICIMFIPFNSAVLLKKAGFSLGELLIQTAIVTFCSFYDYSYGNIAAFFVLSEWVLRITIRLRIE